jgi:hypothetical protein
MTEESDSRNDLSIILILLLKGVLYRDMNEKLWDKLLDLQASVRDYVRLISIELIINENEGFAYLRQIDNENSGGLPSLIVKRQLSYPVSLLLALLRKRLAEHDASSGDSRLILGRDEIIEMIKTFLPSGTNEAKIVDQIDSYINKAVDLGYLRRLKSDMVKFEVRRILKAFIDAEWLNEFDTRLSEYIALNRKTTEAAEEMK